jgi:tRNA1(Val) A37 N6-methylase TrmN6
MNSNMRDGSLKTPVLPTSFAAMPAERVEVSADAVLGGSLTLRQPLRGHRVGHDAILLAAATAARAGEHAVDLGAGVGAAGLALARRVEGVVVTLVEIDAALTALARENAAGNGLAGRARAVCLDVAAPAAAFAAAGLSSGSADRVLMNPPFNATPEQKLSPDPGRRLAHAASPETLRQWVRTAARLLRPSGAVTLIWRADGLDTLLATLAGGFGAVTLLPVHPKPNAAAIRVLARAVKASGAPLSLLPGFVLADAAGEPSAEAEAVLREGAVLPLARE